MRYDYKALADLLDAFDGKTDGEPVRRDDLLDRSNLTPVRLTAAIDAATTLGLLDVAGAEGSYALKHHARRLVGRNAPQILAEDILRWVEDNYTPPHDQFQVDSLPEDLRADEHLFEAAIEDLKLHDAVGVIPHRGKTDAIRAKPGRLTYGR